MGTECTFRPHLFHGYLSTTTRRFKVKLAGIAWKKAFGHNKYAKGLMTPQDR
jgi:hypothetical protein